MKKANSPQQKKLTLSKITVAKLKMHERQMLLVNGGNGTRPTGNGGQNPSFVDEPNNPCVLPPTTGGTGT